MISIDTTNIEHAKQSFVINYFFTGTQNNLLWLIIFLPANFSWPDQDGSKNKVWTSQLVWQV